MVKRPLNDEPHIYRPGGPDDGDIPTCRDCHQSLSTSFLHTHTALKLMDRVRAAEREAAKTAKVAAWAHSDVVTVRSEFGEGYRECQRDIRDILAGKTVVSS